MQLGGAALGNIGTWLEAWLLKNRFGLPLSAMYVLVMDTRTILVIFIAAVAKALILSWWDKFKDRKAMEPTPLVLRKGVYVPWGPVEKIQHYGWRFTQLWMAYIAVLLMTLIYVKLIAPNA